MKLKKGRAESDIDINEPHESRIFSADRDGEAYRDFDKYRRPFEAENNNSEEPTIEDPTDDLSKFPRLKTFSEGRQLYTTMGLSFLGGAVEATCHPLFPLGSLDVPKRPYSNEGEVGVFNGKSWVLGPKVIFVSEDPPVVECQKLLRAKYADGGCFANQPSYGEFLASFEGESPNEIAALERERAGDLLRLSKIGMAEFLDSNPKTSSAETQQLNLF